MNKAIIINNFLFIPFEIFSFILVAMGFFDFVKGPNSGLAMAPDFSLLLISQIFVLLCLCSVFYFRFNVAINIKSSFKYYFSSFLFFDAFLLFAIFSMSGNTLYAVNIGLSLVLLNSILVLVAYGIRRNFKK